MRIQPPGKPVRPARAPNTGNSGGGRMPNDNRKNQINGNPSVSKQSADKKSSAPSMAKSALKFAFTPEIGRSMQGVRFAWDLLVNLVAQVYVMVNLIPADHPCTNLRHAGEYKLTDIIRIAYKSLKWERDQLPQIIIFFAVLLFLVFIVLSFVTLLLNLGMNVAHADDTSTAQNANDILNEIFNVTGSGLIPTALGAMLKAYSNIVLVLAGIILLYHIINYVVESARHGQPGGKSFNHAWAPIRLVFALGLLIPLSSGLNSGQYITVYLAKWGSDMATGVYKQFSNYLGVANNMVSAPSKINSTKIVNDLFELYVCSNYRNQQNPGSINNNPTETPVVGQSNMYELNFSGSSIGDPGCGKIKLYSNTSAESQADQLRNQQSILLLKYQPQIQSLANSVSGTLDPTNSNYYQSIDQSGIKSQIDSIATQYASDVQSAASNAAAAANQQIQSQISNLNNSSLNWVDAPKQIYEFAKQTSAIASAAQSPPSISATSTVLSDLTLNNDGEAPNDKDSNPRNSSNWVISKITGPVMDFLSEQAHELTPVSAIQTSNPYGSLIGYGLKLIALASGLLSIWVTAATATGVALTFSQNAIDTLNPAITVSIGLIFSSGITLGLILPFVPILRFIFAVLGWIVMVVIAVMGMPLFALAHLKTGGEGWIGQLQVASAYNMIIGIILRPTLITIGFFTGMFLFNTFVSLAGHILWGSILSAANPLGGTVGGTVAANAGALSTLGMLAPMLGTTMTGGVGVIGALVMILIVLGAMLFMFSSMCMAIANACFKLVDIIPSQAMTWMGTGPMSSPVEDGTNEIVGETKSQAGEVGKSAGGILTSKPVMDRMNKKGMIARDARTYLELEGKKQMEDTAKKNESLRNDREANAPSDGGDSGQGQQGSGAQFPQISVGPGDRPSSPNPTSNVPPPSNSPTPPTPSAPPTTNSLPPSGPPTQTGAPEKPISPAEARSLMQDASQFQKDQGRMPSIDSKDSWEKRIAQGYEAFGNHAKAGQYGKEVQKQFQQSIK